MDLAVFNVSIESLRISQMDILLIPNDQCHSHVVHVYIQSLLSCIQVTLSISLVMVVIMAVEVMNLNFPISTFLRVFSSDSLKLILV